MNRCTTCNLPHLVGFDYDHDVNEADDFISQTIKRVDGILEAERADEIRSISDLPEDEVAWFRDAIDLEREQEWAEYMQHHCQLHDQALLPSGDCAACIAEEADEVRNDA